jgi:hypothetical protein
MYLSLRCNDLFQLLAHSTVPAPTALISKKGRSSCTAGARAMMDSAKRHVNKKPGVTSFMLGA